MQLPRPPAAVAQVGLRALKTVACADGGFGELERQLLGAAQRHILETDFDLDALEPVEAERLAELLPKDYWKRILEVGVVVALIDGEASEAEKEVLDGFARAFGIKSHVLTDMGRAVDEHLNLLRIDLLRRSFIGKRMAAYLKDRKLRGFVNLVQGQRGAAIPKLAAKYQALADYPDGTLGRGYYQFIRDNEFALPGEAGGAVEPIVFHDCLHVLGGYGTEPIEETQVASFQAGIMKTDSVYGMFFMLAQFQLGITVTPTTEGRRGVVEPELMIEAFVRGTKVTRDLCSDWDWWDDMETSVEELRRRYNIEPRAAAQRRGGD